MKHFLQIRTRISRRNRCNATIAQIISCGRIIQNPDDRCSIRWDKNHLVTILCLAAILVVHGGYRDAMPTNGDSVFAPLYGVSTVFHFG